jgi:ribosomal protein S18 acetylase RimI-like enzyme
MAAIALRRAKPIEAGVCRFDPGRHLWQTAELLRAVFAEDLDVEGQSKLRELQTIGQFSPFLGSLLNNIFYSEFSAGYIWLEAGRVVGNVSFQQSDSLRRADPTGTRWRISNVAVASEYRGRGIAHALVQATLRELADRGGRWAVLQVRAENVAARRLYERLGFVVVCEEGTWQLSQIPVRGKAPPTRWPELDPAFPLRALRAAEWRDRLELARAARSELAHWACPPEPAAYRPGLLQLLVEALGNFTTLRQVGRWGHWRGEKLMGAVVTVADGLGGSHHLSLDVRKEADEGLGGALVTHGLRVLAGAGYAPIVARHCGDHGAEVAALEAAGFRARRVLLTMRREVKSGG